jgi:DNA-binding response OmpR family regulator
MGEMFVSIISDCDATPVELVYYLLGAGHVPNLNTPANMKGEGDAQNSQFIVADTAAHGLESSRWIDSLPSDRAAVTLRLANPSLRTLLVKRQFAAVLQYPDQLPQLSAALQEAERRNRDEQSQLLTAKFVMADARFDVMSRELRGPGGRVQLTISQARLLATLVASPERVVSRRQLDMAIGDKSGSRTARGIDVLVASLRGKLRDAGANAFVTSVRNRGYQISGDWRREAE